MQTEYLTHKLDKTTANTTAVDRKKYKQNTLKVEDALTHLVSQESLKAPQFAGEQTKVTEA